MAGVLPAFRAHVGAEGRARILTEFGEHAQLLGCGLPGRNGRVVRLFANGPLDKPILEKQIEEEKTR